MTNCKGAQASPLGVVTSLFFFLGVHICLCEMSDCVNTKNQNTVNPHERQPPSPPPQQYTVIFLFRDPYLWVRVSVKKRKPCCLQSQAIPVDGHWGVFGCFFSFILDHFLCHSLPSWLSRRPKACKMTSCSDWTGIWW